MKVRRAVVALVVSIVVVGFVIVAVFPTRTYLSQKASISRAEKQLHVLGQQNAELEQRAKQLQSDAEIERLARERYNLVKPGEEAYAVLTPSPACSSHVESCEARVHVTRTDRLPAR